MLFFNPYIEIFLQEIKTVREKHKIIDVPNSPTSPTLLQLSSVPFIPPFLVPEKLSLANK